MSASIIGRYVGLNRYNCGLNRMSQRIYSECFQWHKGLISDMDSARNATFGEVPFMALIQPERFKFLDILLLFDSN